jgi:hypothetical protein
VIAAFVVTLIAVPFLLREADAGSSAPAVASAGPSGDLAVPLRGVSSSVAPAFLTTDVTTIAPSQENTVAVPSPEQGDLARAAYGPIRVTLASTNRIGCETTWVRTGALLKVSNVNNGHAVNCVTVARISDPTVQGLVIRLDATGFSQLADLVESPVTVRVTCEKSGATPATGCQ